MKVRSYRTNLWTMLLLGGCIAAPVPAQPSFSSTSTGSDGALNFTTPGTVMFDPTTFQPPLNPSGNNIYNFTTINIAAGVTVRLSGRNLTGPVYWLASGAVTIAGTLDLNGENGPAFSQSDETRIPAYPGAGGYAGGVGGRPLSTPPLTPQPGSGPGGGGAGSATSGMFNGNSGSNGTFAGTNFFLVPLVGGSGGGGGDGIDAVTIGGGGGGGGGAILIASSSSITIAGVIRANGGAGGTCGSSGCGGNGSGGAIRLISPLVNGAGSLSAAQIRIETSSYPNTLTVTQPLTVSATPNLYLPAIPPGALKVVSVNGVALPAAPAASFTVPDATINASAAVPVVIQAANIPPGTVPTLQFISDSGADFTVQAPALTGTMAQSTATVQVTFPAGFSRGYVLATW